MAEQTLIKTTARFQDNKEPLKQRPIIQFDKPTTATANLPNTVRSSIESGRDNPFRPDGEIYKSADPIVDYYKYGPNQSRTQSPTDSQLLLNGSQGSNGEASSKAKKNKTKRRQEDGNADGEEVEGGSRKSCWRKWLCCCCCSCSRRRCCTKRNQTDGPDDTTATNQEQTVGCADEQRSSQATGSKQERQTKVVVLKEEDNFVMEGPTYSLGTKSSPIELNINHPEPPSVATVDIGSRIEKSEKNERIEINKSTEKSPNSTNSNKSTRCVIS